MFSRRQWLQQLAAGVMAAPLADCRCNEAEPPEAAGSLIPRATGALPARTESRLLAACSAIIGYPIETEHYREFFAWRARTFAGYRGLYQSYGQDLEAEARARGRADFVGCAPGDRASIHGKLVAAAGGPFLAIGHRIPRVETRAELPFVYRRHVEHEMLWLFYVTDAWVVSSGEPWPATPRGLERYTTAPRSRSGEPGQGGRR